MSDYRWDLFISYKRRYNTEFWVREVLYPALCRHAPEVGIPKERIFLDEESLDPGSRVAQVQPALLTSACMLAVWTPNYFYESAWCWREWRTMVNRDQACGKRAPGYQGTSLVCPLLLKDGPACYPIPQDAVDSLPDRAFLDFATLHPRQRGSKLWSRFEERLIVLCARLKERIANSPPHDDTWTFDGSPPPAPPTRSFPLPR